ncbi:chitobiase/beta-hexosaminidase C-terminal domain-containing protein, partial [Paenibacillus athensensis]|uniref:chitobiase/beta-hexosaminidase C-terminal domain-containing protein n=1 Tax=Paenibacillus athensensis TaxID=1967502 RepID=UPI001E3FEA72
GNVINYSFTYFNGAAADTAWYSYTVGSQASVATPTFSPDPSATYTSAVTVTISTATSGADIYYTTDGSAPTTSSTKYTSGFALSQSATVKAIAVKAGMTPSAVASAAYAICSSNCTPPPTDPGLDHGVDVSGTTAVAWYKPSSGMSWVDIHYNVNSGAQQNVRTTYNAAQSRYEQTMTVAAGNVINYSFTYFNGAAADTAWYSYTVGSQASVATPTFSPDPSATYTSAVTVTISTA